MTAARPRPGWRTGAAAAGEKSCFQSASTPRCSWQPRHRSPAIDRLLEQYAAIPLTDAYLLARLEVLTAIAKIRAHRPGWQL